MLGKVPALGNNSQDLTRDEVSPPIQQEQPNASIQELGNNNNGLQAQAIVKELYQRYRKQIQRWQDYRNLFLFLSFVALFLGILYGQRQANTAYKVHRTMEDELVPQDDSMNSADDVYGWLSGLLSDVWVDPKCGDGICESPFEFASYSRFGCRADCGKLQDIQNLTVVQVDVYYDFSHPLGSMPASDLMQQAQYNLCPVSTAYSGGCYYDQDVTFDRLSGSMSTVITDMPDGDWDLVMRRDIFDKTSGAIRDFNALNAVAYYYRAYVAAVAALAEQNTEIALLDNAVTIGSSKLTNFIQQYMPTLTGANATEVAIYMQQFVNATCACDAIPMDSSGTSPTWLANGTLLQAFNSSNGGTTDYTVYKPAVCDPIFNGVVSGLSQLVKANSTASGLVFGAVASGTDYTTVKVQQAVDQTNQTQMISFCSSNLANLTWWRDVHINLTRSLLVDQRLGDGKTTGKIAARNAVITAMHNFVMLSMPEMLDPMFTYPSQSVLDDTNLPTARIDSMTEYFVAGKTYFTTPAPAALAINRRTIYAPSITQALMVAKATARINETQFQQSELLSLIGLSADLNSEYQKFSYPTRITVEELVTSFNLAQGTPDNNSPLCNTTRSTSFGSTTRVWTCTKVTLPTAPLTPLYLPNNSLPDASSPALNLTVWGGVGLQTQYDLVAWEGNSTAYMTCNLKQRGPQYIGTCQDMNVTCATTGNDTAPYACTDMQTNIAVSGTLADVSYRTGCEFPCDMQLDCNAICECYGTCGTTQQCVCDACYALNIHAASQDDSFVDITDVAISGGQTTATLATLPTTTTGRRLLQSSDNLTEVLTEINTVQQQQTALQTQMLSLQTEVAKANALAAARAGDTTLVDLITQGRQDILAGQARVDAKLDEIIGKQNQALAVAQAATQALTAIQGLQAKQLAAQQALEKAVQSQLTAIKTATYSGVITLTQALALWKRARRDRAVTNKASSLANLPCTNDPSADNTFTLSNGNQLDTSTARERNIGLTNRVIAGLMLHQTRTNDTFCADSKFNKIQQTCTGPISIQAFGVDPVFKLGTTSYNPDLNDVAGQLVVGYYNCSLTSTQTYNLATADGQIVNPAPYCAELYNRQNLPYAFHYLPMENKAPGFPVFFDINLSADGATAWETFLEEGLYLDQHTRSMTAELVTYNAQLRIFGYYNINFFFSDGGSIKVTYRLHTIRVEVYNSQEDKARLAFEIILSIIIFSMLLYSLTQMLMTHRREGNMLKFFAHGWDVVDLVSNCLLAVCMIIWWVWVTMYANKFDITLRRDVYASLEPDANYLALNAQGSEMAATEQDFQRLRNTIDLLNWYFALNGINILLLIARVLKLMDFQPRLGVVTRSLWLAGPDLIHFAIVAGMVFVGYAMMAHLIFGNAILEFKTFGDSINTCFEILLGNIDVNAELRALGGLQSVAGALFFWSYELLVFMVLLNFLLAIIVDAFSEVKDTTHEVVGIHTELYQLMMDRWRSMTGSCASQDYVSDKKLGKLLKQWAGGDDDDDDTSEAQGEANKLLTILNEDLDEEDLRNVLMECLRDLPVTDATTNDDTKRKGLARFLPTHRPITATPEEIVQAAKYIMDRFGVPVDDEEEQELQEEANLNANANAAHGSVPQGNGVAFPGSGQGMNDSIYRANSAIPTMSPAVIDKERDQLARALERLAEVQRELADGQRNLMMGQKRLADQQAHLVGMMRDDAAGQSTHT